MSKDDKQFLDGLFLGAIIAGLAIVTVITFILYTKGEEVGENISEPPEIIEQEQASLEERIAENVEFSGKLLDTIAINDQQYVVIQLLKHPKDDLVFRLLALKTSDLQDKIDKNRDPLFSTAFNGDTMYYTGDETPTHGEKVVFSFWKSNGQELVMIDEDNENIPQAPVGFVRVLKWLDDNLILESSQGDAGIGTHDIFKYNPEYKSVSNLLSYKTGWYINEDTDTEIIYMTWSQNGRTVGQIVDTDGGPYSNLYYLPSEDVEWESISRYLIAFATTSEVGADITSDHNLIRYSEGLEIIVEGENSFIPWTLK